MYFPRIGKFSLLFYPRGEIFLPCRYYLLLHQQASRSIVAMENKRQLWGDFHEFLLKFISQWLKKLHYFSIPGEKFFCPVIAIICYICKCQGVLPQQFTSGNCKPPFIKSIRSIFLSQGLKFLLLFHPRGEIFLSLSFLKIQRWTSFQKFPFCNEKFGNVMRFLYCDRFSLEFEIKFSYIKVVRGGGSGIISMDIRS